MIYNINLLYLYNYFTNYIEMLLKNKKISIINDSLGNPYYAIKIFKEEIEYYLNQISYLPNIYFSNRENRDGYDYHITVFHNITKFDFSDKLIDVKLIGVGELYDKDNHSVFIVCEIDDLSIKKDYHITLGFNKKDVFKGRKDRSSLIMI